MMGFIVLVVALIAIYFFCSISVKRHEKIIRDGRPIMATIKSIRAAASDGSGYMNVEYVLNAEGRVLKRKESINPLYAPQLQPGMTIKIMYVDDKQFVLMFNEQA
ncbi:hypothetical protein GA0061071_107189 [Kosakonia oryzendophytica]|uniref:DUF3592 domain-containing protein n=1 Tax=Kosakonia oryzendophytica TaxID=1005665 RepID=A0A1C4CFD1_9ENTR|nr:hypothetical protein [Kosakonia oryzendophytica]TDT59280.1 hypothetical protein DFO53_0851 [Enterobacter sp. AG5470]SCC17820.1 hypothetical protein GA0061071_107189 [Kosakonia oryzendophytica]